MNLITQIGYEKKVRVDGFEHGAAEWEARMNPLGKMMLISPVGFRSLKFNFRVPTGIGEIGFLSLLIY